jgi:hypothetical protein
LACQIEIFPQQKQQNFPVKFFGGPTFNNINGGVAALYTVSKKGRF